MLEILFYIKILEKYLETIVKLLVKDGILVGLRGKGGGYRLKKAPGQITVGHILRLTEDSLAPVSCLQANAAACERAAACRTLPMWKGLYDLINEYLNKYTLEDLVQSGDKFDYVI